MSASTLCCYDTGTSSIVCSSVQNLVVVTSSISGAMTVGNAAFYSLSGSILNLQSGGSGNGSGSDIIACSTLVGSTLTGNSLSTASATIQALSARTLRYSTLIGSSIYTALGSVSTLAVSSLSGGSLTGYTVAAQSSVTAPRAVFSTLSVSSLVGVNGGAISLGGGSGTGATGPRGVGDHFSSATTAAVALAPVQDGTVSLNIEPGLAYITGNSVVVVCAIDRTVRFQAQVTAYDAASGQLDLELVSSVAGDFVGLGAAVFNVNLDGVDGPTGWTGATGWTGPQGATGYSDRFLTQTAAVTLQPVLAGSLVLAVAPNLAYVAGNSVVVVSASDPSLRFSAQVSDYATLTGQLSLADIQGIYGDFSSVVAQRYIVNLDGVDGPTGPTGQQGIQGIQGIRGVTGDFGPTGAQGFTGPKGDIGLRGLQGVQGPTGAIGAQGVKGETGDQGETGAQGIQGIRGVTGDFGPTGAQGFTGPKGDIGLRGLQGVQGPTGAVGAQGVKGETGDQGETGAQGIQGPQGPQGIQGTQGLRGPQGMTGQQGPKGETGYTGAVGTGPTGIQGPTGFADRFQTATLSAVTVLPVRGSSVSLTVDPNLGQSL
jgi:Collagen triple helix repeat (20 copies)